jgi:hypothetical protein
VYPVRAKEANCHTAVPTTRKTDAQNKHVYGN